MKPRKPFYLDTLYCSKCGKRYRRKDFNGDVRPLCPIHHIFLRAGPRQRKWKDTLKEKQAKYRIYKVNELVKEIQCQIEKLDLGV